MYKLIDKSLIDLEELKTLKDNNIRPILYGDFSDEEKQRYYALGIYDVANTKAEAEQMIDEPTKYENVKINNTESEEKVRVIEKEIPVSKPSIFKKPVKLAIFGLSAVAIMGGIGMAYGFNNTVINTPDVVAKTNKRDVDISSTLSTAIKTELTPEQQEEITEELKTTSKPVVSDTVEQFKKEEVIAGTEESEKTVITKSEQGLPTENKEVIKIEINNPEPKEEPKIENPTGTSSQTPAETPTETPASPEQPSTPSNSPEKTPDEDPNKEYVGETEGEFIRVEIEDTNDNHFRGGLSSGRKNKTDTVEEAPAPDTESLVEEDIPTDAGNTETSSIDTTETSTEDVSE